MAIPMLKSILSLAAIQTAVECSAAFPTMATTITPIKTSVTPSCALADSTEVTRNSESQAIKTVATSRTKMALDFDHPGSLEGAGEDAGEGESEGECEPGMPETRSLWVTSENASVQM